MSTYKNTSGDLTLTGNSGLATLTRDTTTHDALTLRRARIWLEIVQLH